MNNIEFQGDKIDISGITDKQIFTLSNTIVYEIIRRIINTIKKYNATCYSFNCDKIDLPYIRAYTDDGITEIQVESVGYLLSKDGKKQTSKEILYVISAEDQKIYYEDDIFDIELWDIYKQILDELK